MNTQLIDVENIYYKLEKIASEIQILKHEITELNGHCKSNEEKLQLLKKSNEYSEIICVKDICGGEPVIKGTRTPVRTIIQYMRMGCEVEEILEHLPHLSVEQIHAALEYYREHKVEIDKDIELNNDEAFWKIWLASSSSQSIPTKTSHRNLQNS